MRSGDKDHPLTMTVSALACLLGLVVLWSGCAPAEQPAPTSDKQPQKADWRREPTTGDKPSARGAGKWVALGNKLVMFGGFKECFDKDQAECDHLYYDDLYVFDTEAKTWEKRLPDGGVIPGKRAFPGATAYQKKQTAVFFGGTEYNVKLSQVKVHEDLWEYDLKANKWTERSYGNQGPGARLGAEIVIKDDTLYLFGGYDKTFKAHNDLWSYDLLTNTWQQLKKDDDPGSPSKRYIFRFELSPSREEIYIFGGNYRETFTIQRNDLWKYNIASNSFTEIVSEKQTNITGRTHGAAALAGDRFLIAFGDIPDGGCTTNQASEHQNPTDEVWSVKINDTASDRKWERVEIGTGPAPLKRIFYAQAGDRLYVTHGFNFKCGSGEDAGAIYNLETYSLPLNQVR
jgi:N-acetylneuraminic acid mutarotase